jgi:hypothetical protein
MEPPEQENFEALRRLLTLKRYEQPPPGFYASFADRVRVRIETGEEARQPAPSLWARIFGRLEPRPALAGACAVAACAILVWKVGFEVGGAPATQPVLAGSPAAPPPPQRLSPMPTFVRDPALLAGTDAKSTAPVSSFSPMLGTPPPSFMFKPGWGMQGMPRGGAGLSPNGESVNVSLEIPAPAGVSTGASSGVNPGAGSPR